MLCCIVHSCNILHLFHNLNIWGGTANCSHTEVLGYYMILVVPIDLGEPLDSAEPDTPLPLDSHRCDILSG